MDGKLWKMSEKSEINGGPYQYDDYGTVDKTRIIDQDELVSLIDFFYLLYC